MYDYHNLQNKTKDIKEELMQTQLTNSSIPQDEIKNSIWKALDIVRGTVDPSEYKNYILVIFFLKYISDLKKDFDERSTERKDESYFIIPKGCSFDELYANINKHNLGEIFNLAFRKIEDANIEMLGDIFSSVDFNAHPRAGTRNELNEGLRYFVDYLYKYLDLRVSRTNNANLAGDIFSYLITLFARLEGFRGGESYTPQHLLPLIIKLFQPKSGKTLYDPAIGTGGMLIAASQYVREKEGDGKNLNLFGQDISHESVLLARMNSYFHRIFDATIFYGDTLREPRNIYNEKLQKFDYILSNPPLVAKIRREAIYELMVRDTFNRFPFGIPSRSADFLFLQHIIASLNESGKAVVIVPSGMLFVSGTDGEIRKRIIERDLIEAVIGLGPGLLASTGIPINLLIINKLKPEGRKNKILLINATEEYERINRAGSFINLGSVGVAVKPARCGGVKSDKIRAKRIGTWPKQK